MNRILALVCVGLFACCGALGVLALNLSERAGVLEQANAQLGQDLKSAEEQKLLLFKRNEQDAALLAAAERANRSFRSMLFEKEQALIGALSDEECADVALPGAALDGLQWIKGDHKARDSS